jgi:hypothetical protein
MKPFYTSIVLIFATLALNAQVVIDSSHMPIPGDTIRFSTTNNLNGLNYTNTDTAYIWDFSSISSTEDVMDTFVSVNSTNMAYMAVYANPFDQDNKATVAQPQKMQAIPMVQITESFNFYKNSSSRFVMQGLGAKINGVPLPFIFDKPDVWYNFPVTYGTRDTSDSEFHADIPSLGYFGQQRHRVNLVDGWGTLYLPSDTFSVIHVKSMVSYYDTIYYDSIGFGLGFNRNVTEYKWLAEGFHEPVLQIDKQGQNNVSVKYLYTAPSGLAVKPIETTDPIRTYPNPVTDLLTIDLSTINESVTLTISDISGREIINKKIAVTDMLNSSQIELPVGKLPGGLYFIGIKTTTSNCRGKFLKF